jgi:DNA-binding MarR family transcriptional regulator
MARRTSPRKTLRDDAATLLARCPACNARLAARHITAFLERALSASGLGVAQLNLMAQIAAATDDTLVALARRCGLDASTLSRNLRTLERDGLVEIVAVEADLRRRAVWLTETGARRLEAAIPLWRDAQGRLARKLSGDLARRLAREAETLGGA